LFVDIGNIASYLFKGMWHKGILFKENYNTYPFDRDSIIKWNRVEMGNDMVGMDCISDLGETV
jgi:hypothetical protein